MIPMLSGSGSSSDAVGRRMDLTADSGMSSI
jgi:hypothetical protein